MAPLDPAPTGVEERDRHVGRLAAVVDSSDDAIIAWGLDGVVTDWNPAAERMLGYTRDEAIGMQVRELWGPDERVLFAELSERLAGGETPARYEGTRLRKDHTFVEAAVALSPIVQADGKVIGVSSTMRDVTEHKRATELLVEERNRWAGAFQGAPNGMALVDLNGQWLAVNAALCRLLGRTELECLTTDFQSLTHPEDLDSDLEQVRRVLAGEIGGYEMEKRYVRPDGSVVWGLLSVSLVKDANDEPLYFVSQIQDITARKEADAELARYSEELSELARRDLLTGLRNHREFHGMLELELARAQRDGDGDRPLSVVLLEVDAYEQLSGRDRPSADRLLVQAGAALDRAARSSDLAARIGPAQFALILRDADQLDARDAAERICRDVESTGITSLSYGIASWPGDGDTSEQLLLCADTQLEAARRSAHDARNPGAGSPETPTPDLDAIRQIVGIAQEHLGMDLAYFSEISDRQQTLRTLGGDGSSFGFAEGDVRTLDATYCAQMLTGAVPNAVDRVTSYPSLCELPVTSEGGIGSYVGVPIRLTNGHLHGTLCTISHQPVAVPLEAKVRMLRSLAHLLARQIEHDAMEASDRRSEAELAGVHALLSALEARDHYTGEHSRTVVQLATDVARQLGVSEHAIRDVEHVALLHDIGKVGIPDSVLQKRGPLNDQEWDLMHQHPAIGARILAGTRSLAHLALAINAEHERFDGSGYPDGLRGEAIPLASRITFACDAYHAMTSNRPYRAAMEESAARDELRAGAGTQFDPTVVDALLAVLAATDAPPAPAVSPAGRVLDDVLAQQAGPRPLAWPLRAGHA